MATNFIEENQKKEKSKVDSFEDLNVFKKARDLTNKIYDITKFKPFAKDYGLIDQIRRASISIMSNLAEGFERVSNTEFIQYLFIAKGSCGEVRAQLTITSDQKYIDDKTYEDLYDLCRIINKMLSNFISYLKRSNYKGTKYKNQPA